jgi:4-amino-4-deoxy-L-arabinose transferase-like glycosyltransferase
MWRTGGHGFRPHWDEFRSGSGGGNCGLPGNEDCHVTLPASLPHSANPDSFGGGIWRTIGGFEPALQGLVWAAVLGAVLYMSWGERRVRRLYYLAAWFFAAVSTLGKGPAGFGLPILVTLAYLAASRPGEEFHARVLRVVRELGQFEIVGGFLVILAVAMPWYVAMYVRHGAPFTDRLIFHDMFNRAFSHVHDTNEGDDTSFRFYVWQLGYALFPWTGLAPLGLLWWLRRGSGDADNVGDGAEVYDKRADASVLLCMWFLLGFALFSFMGTKFHHNIFPAVPPTAMLIGVVLDDMIGRRTVAARGALPAYLLGVMGGMTLMVLGVTRMQPGSFFGLKPDGHLANPSIAMGVVLSAAGAGMTMLFVLLFRCKDATSDTDSREEEDVGAAHTSRMLAAGAVAAGLLLAVVARDLVVQAQGADQPGAIRLLQLFTYNYRRGWPDSLDFSAALAGFGAVATVLSLALAVRAIRRHAVFAMCAFAFVWALWGLDVYMEKTAQHWGQHEVIAAYYEDRASPDEMLVAYQMNWKGENFYTGNHIPAFVSTGSTFTTWLKKQRDAGVKVMYFITEHGRVGGLKGEVSAKAYREVTDKVLCNKFVLVRAEL